MREDFLFDDEDPKQRGVGIDRMGDKKDGLKLIWKWWQGKPSQVCSAEVGNFGFQVIFWNTSYEAELTYLGEKLISKNPDDKNKIKTRLDGQRIAEKLLLEFKTEIEMIINKHLKQKN